MIRLLIFIIPLVLPSVVYALWRWRQPDKHVDNTIMPWIASLGGGVLLLVLTLWIVGFSNGGQPGERYSPPRFEEGVLVPGGFGDDP